MLIPECDPAYTRTHDVAGLRVALTVLHASTDNAFLTSTSSTA
jgi:hypothetical protein